VDIQIAGGRGNRYPALADHSYRLKLELAGKLPALLDALRLVKTPYPGVHQTGSRPHLANFAAAYNFAKRLKALQGLTPYEFICRCWTKEP
jgi:hypothetical protein